MSQGKKNVYTCDVGHRTITVDRDEGVTPFMIRCQWPSCASMARSEFYRVGQGAEASHEFYRPCADERKTLFPALRDHVDNGGLMLRRIGVKFKRKRDVRAQQLPRGKRP